MRRSVLFKSKGPSCRRDVAATPFNPSTIRKENRMFTRVVEIRTKAGKARDFSTTLNEKVLPLLRKQPGFIDEITLVSRAQPERILALSFWTNEQDAER